MSRMIRRHLGSFFPRLFPLNFPLLQFSSRKFSTAPPTPPPSEIPTTPSAAFHAISSHSIPFHDAVAALYSFSPQTALRKAPWPASRLPATEYSKAPEKPAIFSQYSITAPMNAAALNALCEEFVKALDSGRSPSLGDFHFLFHEFLRVPVDEPLSLDRFQSIYALFLTFGHSLDFLTARFILHFLSARGLGWPLARFLRDFTLESSVTQTLMDSKTVKIESGLRERLASDALTQSCNLNSLFQFRLFGRVVAHTEKLLKLKLLEEGRGRGNKGKFLVKSPPLFSLEAFHNLLLSFQHLGRPDLIVRIFEQREFFIIPEHRQEATRDSELLLVVMEALAATGNGRRLGELIRSSIGISPSVDSLENSSESSAMAAIDNFSASLDSRHFACRIRCVLSQPQLKAADYAQTLFEDFERLDSEGKLLSAPGQKTTLGKEFYLIALRSLGNAARRADRMILIPSSLEAFHSEAKRVFDFILERLKAKFPEEEILSSPLYWDSQLKIHARQPERTVELLKEARKFRTENPLGHSLVLPVSALTACAAGFSPRDGILFNQFVRSVEFFSAETNCDDFHFVEEFFSAAARVRLTSESMTKLANEKFPACLNKFSERSLAAFSEDPCFPALATSWAFNSNEGNFLDYCRAVQKFKIFARQCHALYLAIQTLAEGRKNQEILEAWDIYSKLVKQFNWRPNAAGAALQRVAPFFPDSLTILQEFHQLAGCAGGDPVVATTDSIIIFIQRLFSEERDPARILSSCHSLLDFFSHRRVSPTPHVFVHLCDSLVRNFGEPAEKKIALEKTIAVHQTTGETVEMSSIRALFSRLVLVSVDCSLFSPFHAKKFQKALINARLALHAYSVLVLENQPEILQAVDEAGRDSLKLLFSVDEALGERLALLKEISSGVEGMLKIPQGSLQLMTGDSAGSLELLIPIEALKAQEARLLDEAFSVNGVVRRDWMTAGGPQKEDKKNC